MPDENTSESKSRFARAKDWAELLSKLIPLVAGIIYVAGYLVTAQRLADYNVSITQLINAQYFTAGMAPGLMTCLTFAAICHAYTYDFSKLNKLNLAGALTAVLFLLTLIFMGIDWTLNRFWRVRILGDDHWFDFYVLTLVRLVMGLAAVWYLVGGVKSRTFINSLKQFKGTDLTDAIKTPVYVLLIAVASLVFCYQRATSAYARIPQAYGGGRPLSVRLYVERDKTPTELIDAGSITGDDTAAKNPGNPPANSPTPAADSNHADKALVYSIPLRLIFQTSESLIVDSAATGQQARVWTLDVHAVHAVLSSP